MNKTQIEWAKNPDGSQGYTWNPISGCLNHANGLCKGGGFPCYAYKLAHGRLKQRYLANENFYVTTTWGDALARRDPFYPRFWEERMEEVLHRRLDSPLKGIFVCDMGDLFGIGVPEEWTREVLSAIETNFYDRFYLLTKQPQNLARWSPFPDNCWVGVTATEPHSLLNAVNYLVDIRASVKFISLEPLLAWGDTSGPAFPLSNSLKGLSQLIIGQQTPIRKATTPRIQDIAEIVQAADTAGVKVFLTDNLDPLLRTVDAQIPTGLCDNYGHTLRQEMPTAQFASFEK